MSRPAGARAGSAGFFLLESADVAAMAPGTNAGAAHPVVEFGGKPDDIMAQKIENDTEAFLRSYVTKRNRDTEAARGRRPLLALLHRRGGSGPAPDRPDRSQRRELLQALDGRTITRLDGSKLTLHLAGARIELLKPTLRDQLLGWLVNPNIALLFFVCGALLIYLEFNSPGTIVPGALGTLMVLLAIFAFDLLPIRYTAVMLLVAAIALLLLEAKFGGHGALAIAGIVCLTFGLLTLVAAPVPELGINLWMAIAVSASFSVITVVLMGLAFRARRMKTSLGVDAMIGSLATAMEPLTPEGHVLVEGEIWRAVAAGPVATGAQLKVIGHEQYLLHVDLAEPSPPSGTPS